MKNKIKEVIDFVQDCGALKDGAMYYEACTNDYLAELLAANNIVKLPARIGQQVWGVFTPCGGCELSTDDSRCVVCERAFADKILFDWEMVPAWGKDVFATEEAARAAAKKRRGENDEDTENS